MRTLIRATVALSAPGLLALAVMLPISREAPAAGPDSGTPDVSPMLDVYKPPPYPPKFDAGKPKLDAAGLDAKKDAPLPQDATKPIPPDPTPLFTDAVWVLSVKFDKGVVSITKVKHEKLAVKGTVDRRFGRFAAELYSGPTLVERVRFDFPLINDDSVASEIYEKGLVVSVDVKIPDSDRPNKLEIWDRANDKRWKFDYPPK
jgi:hypothetical protein